MVRVRRRAGWKARCGNVSRSACHTCCQSPTSAPACRSATGRCTATGWCASRNARLTAARASSDGACHGSAASTVIVADSQRHSSWQSGQPARCCCTRSTSAGSSRPSAKSASCSSQRWLLLSSLICIPTEEKRRWKIHRFSQLSSSRMPRSFSRQRARIGPMEPVVSPSLSAISA